MNNISVVKNVYEALGKGNMPSVLGAIYPKIEWHEAMGICIYLVERRLLARTRY